VIEQQASPLGAVYPIIYLDFLSAKIRQDECAVSKLDYPALGGILADPNPIMHLAHGTPLDAVMCHGKTTRKSLLILDVSMNPAPRNKLCWS